MSEPAVLDAREADRVGSAFGVSLEQVRRDHVISQMLAALTPLSNGLIFFGGTAVDDQCRRSPR